MYMRLCVITQEETRAQLNMIDSPSELATQLLCGNTHQPKIIGSEKQ